MRTCVLFQVPANVPKLGNGVVKKISLLGSTGSIGTQTLDIVEENPDKFQVVALSAGNNIDLVAEQVRPRTHNCKALDPLNALLMLETGVELPLDDCCCGMC